MKFSILIPTLNEEKYLPLLLESLKKQTFKDFEIIICDGHSADSTVSKAKRFSHSLKLKIVVSQKRNISHQRNLAAKYAASENLIFLDADTTVEKNFLFSVNHALLNKNFTVAASWLTPNSKNIFDKIIFSFFNRIYLETAKHFTPGGTGAFLFVKKESFKSVGGFDLTTNFGEDFDFIKRLHHKGCRYYLFRNLAIRISVRRLDKEGRLFFLYKMIRSGLYYHLHGTIRDPKVYLKNEFGKF